MQEKRENAIRLSADSLMVSTDSLMAPADSIRLLTDHHTSLILN